ncbi:MAG: glycosyltransferase family 4 protein [Candidatus Methanofastidiosa archaeon]|nr:glycosyltransferase family 4 protein [Candidatus Methanofastidiosa archaeon]HOM95819.1 glycosyltransferase family 4 protein [Methanofastidiosum sp.]HRS25486.1 glycosyltransferase family 4 protein [Methanofastidiosum sp.]
MNVLMIGEYPPKIGGISIHISQLKKELKKLDQNIFVLTYSNSIEKDVYSVKFPNKFRGIFFIVFGFFKGIYIIRKNKIDIIHSHFATTSGFLGLLLSLVSRRKRVMTVHGSDINVHLKKRVLGKLVKLILSHYQFVIAVSPDLADKAKNLVNGEIFSIPNGVDHAKFIPNKSKKKGIGFVGALVNEKNPQEFIDLIRKLRQKGILEPAYIIGDGYLRVELEEISKGLNIKFIGEINDIENYLNKFLCVVSTSRTEGFGLSILESMACGVPVVAYKSPGSDYLLSDLGLIAQNKNELVKLTIKLIIDPKFREDASRKVFEKSNLFSWKKCALDTLEVYKKLN